MRYAEIIALSNEREITVIMNCFTKKFKLHMIFFNALFEFMKHIHFDGFVLGFQMYCS